MASPLADQRFREALTSAPLGVVLLDPERSVVYANPPVLQLLGFASAADMTRAQIFDDELPDGEGEFRVEGHDTVLATVDGGGVQVRIDGRRDSSGFWSLYVHEIGREREREADLARALAELENTMQTIPDILYTLDVEARLVRWNRKLETVTGWQPDELLLTPGFELFDDDERATFARAIMDAFAHGYAEFEATLRARDGGLIPYQWTAVPLEDSQKRVVGLAGAGRDISERKRGEEARARLEQLIRNRAQEWQMTFDAIESPIVISDPKGQILRINDGARRLLGELSFNDVVRHSLDDFGQDEPWRSFARLIRAEIPSGSDVYDPFSGRSWHVAMSTLQLPAPLAEADGQSMRLILLGRDITRMLELQSVARKNQVMSAVGQLIVGVAHEVRNPIFGISATLDAFEASFAVDADARQFIEVLRGEIGRLSDLMQELLDYGRPAVMERSEAALVEIVSQAMRSCGPLAERASVTLENHVRADLPLVLADRRRLGQVYQNLIQNGVQFSQPGSSVRVEASVVEAPDGRWIASVVSDSGPGFRAVDLPKIFEPFFTRRRGGTGLGLSIVQRIVEEHGGKVQASNLPAGGAAMTVFLPLV